MPAVASRMKSSSCLAATFACPFPGRVRQSSETLFKAGTINSARASCLCKFENVGSTTASGRSTVARRTNHYFTCIVPALHIAKTNISDRESHGHMTSIIRLAGTPGGVFSELMTTTYILHEVLGPNAR